MEITCGCTPAADTQVTSVVLYLAAVIGLALTPGPTVMAVALFGMQERAPRVLMFISGILAANAAYVVGAAVVRATGFILPCLAKCLLPPVGAIFLILIGGQMLLANVFNGRLPDRSANPLLITSNGSFAPFVQGFLIHGLNPNTLVFFTGIFLTIVPLDENYVRMVVLLGFFAIGIDALVLFSYWQVTNRIPKILVRPKLAQVAPALAGVSLIVLSIWKLALHVPQLLSFTGTSQ